MWIGFTWLGILLNARIQFQVTMIIMHINRKIKGDRGQTTATGRVGQHI
jgi:hypothetical protein